MMHILARKNENYLIIFICWSTRYIIVYLLFLQMNFADATGIPQVILNHYMYSYLPIWLQLFVRQTKIVYSSKTQGTRHSFYHGGSATRVENTFNSVCKRKYCNNCGLSREELSIPEAPTVEVCKTLSFEPYSWIYAGQYIDAVIKPVVRFYIQPKWKLGHKYDVHDDLIFDNSSTRGDTIKIVDYRTNQCIAQYESSHVEGHNPKSHAQNRKCGQVARALLTVRFWLDDDMMHYIKEDLQCAACDTEYNLDSTQVGRSEWTDLKFLLYHFGLNQLVPTKHGGILVTKS